jgi:hypothetical protein
VKKKARKSPMRRSYESYISTSDGSQSRYYDYQARSVILEGQACSVVPRCAKVCRLDILAMFTDMSTAALRFTSEIPASVRRTTLQPEHHGRLLTLLPV